jgi:hypothetical protein
MRALFRGTAQLEREGPLTRQKPPSHEEVQEKPRHENNRGWYCPPDEGTGNAVCLNNESQIRLMLRGRPPTCEIIGTQFQIGEHRHIHP